MYYKESKLSSGKNDVFFCWFIRLDKRRHSVSRVIPQ